VLALALPRSGGRVSPSLRFLRGLHLRQYGWRVPWIHIAGCHLVAFGTGKRYGLGVNSPGVGTDYEGNAWHERKGCISLTIFIGLLLLNPMFLELGRLDIFVISIAAYAQCEADLSNSNVGVFRHCLGLPNQRRIHFLGSAAQPAPGERQQLIRRGCAAQSTCALSSANAPKI